MHAFSHSLQCGQGGLLREVNAKELNLVVITQCTALKEGVRERRVSKISHEIGGEGGICRNERKEKFGKTIKPLSQLNVKGVVKCWT